MNTNKGFGLYLDRTYHKINATYTQAFKENNINLTIEQWVILQRIYLLGEEASQSAISKISYRNRAATSRVIGGLCKKGFVTKSRFKGDAKRYKLELTEEGEAVVQQVLPLTRKLRGVAYQNLHEDEFEIFLDVLNQIWENYDNYEIQQKKEGARIEEIKLSYI